MVAERDGNIDRIIARLIGDFELDDLVQRSQLALVEFRESVRE